MKLNLVGSALVSSFILSGCGESGDGQASSQGPAGLKTGEDYSLQMKGFALQGDMARQPQKSGAGGHVYLFSGKEYGLKLLPRISTNATITVVDAKEAPVAVADPSGKRIMLVANVSRNTKVELRQSKAGKKALVISAQGATALVTEPPPWAQELAQAKGAQVWRAGAYDVCRSTSNTCIEFAIPEGEASIRLIPLRPR